MKTNGNTYSHPKGRCPRGSVACTGCAPASNESTDVTLVAGTQNYLLANVDRSSIRSADVDPNDPMGSRAAAWIAWNTDHPELVNRLAEQVADTGRHTRHTGHLVANPVVDDLNRARIVTSWIEESNDMGSGAASTFSTTIYEVRNHLGPETVEALSYSPDRDILRILAEHDDLTDNQIDRLCNPTAPFHMRRYVEVEIAQNHDGRFNPALSEAMRTRLRDQT